ncbi:MAG: protein-glutamate O-methyltransferase CheR [Proteobacteria bacterium]|nr:protein-glutamate O-methyltransferase CheR [Pseudomonadota bacterium]NOG58917.1 protein-glutamate O-methyltransferase CheR [Pseudomonadota bacterium]
MLEAQTQSKLKSTNKTGQQDTREYLAFCDFLEKTSGITLGENKAYLVKNRLRPIMEAHNVESLSAATEKIKSGRDPKLKLEIIDAMTTNETSWFRDQYPFEYLHDELLPKLASNRMGTPRIWSAACSYGHEAYSISMIIEEYIAKNPGSFPGGIQIIGTDISSRVVASATKAEFDYLSISRGLSEERKKKYFIQTREDYYKLNEKIKSRVRFQNFNLLESYASLGKFDIIFCRNVLIYFSAENKTEIMNKFSQSLKKDGVFILGASETVTNHCTAFEMVKCPRGVVYKPV